MEKAEAKVNARRSGDEKVLIRGVESELVGSSGGVTQGTEGSL